MIISFVVAFADDGAMGRDNSLPWHLPADMQHFKRSTLGKPVIMGRKSWESLGGKPLPKRPNIVLSSKELELPAGVWLFKSAEDAIEMFKNEEEICIIGGAQIFSATIPLANLLNLTRIHTTFPDADVFFPKIRWNEWKLVWEEAHAADAANEYAFTFQRWERVAASQIK